MVFGGRSLTTPQAGRSRNRPERKSISFPIRIFLPSRNISSTRCQNGCGSWPSHREGWISVCNERTTDSKTGEAKTLEFKYNGGIGEYVASQSRQKRTYDKPIHMRRDAQDSGVALDVAVQYNDGYSENVFSFANNINTVEGGTHLSGFRSGAYAHDQRLRAEGLPKT